MKSLPEIVLFENEKILEAVGQIARSVVRWLGASGSPSVVLVPVLEGAKPFARDLLIAMMGLAPEIKIETHEVRVKGTEGTRLLENRQWLDCSLEPGVFAGKRVLVADDLVDSGKTLESLRNRLLSLGAVDVKTAVLLRKFGKESGPVDFCGIELDLDREFMDRKGLKDYWLFGYGMDLNGQFRELDHIGWVEINETEKN